MGADPEHAGLSTDLEALKQQLIAMRPQDISAFASAEMAAQISAIRLQLKRLEAERASLLGNRDA
jgi:hypothetical protein